MTTKRVLMWGGSLILLALSWVLPETGLLNPYVVQILMYVGINMILTLALNLVNGYMGEFSVATPASWASAPTSPPSSPWPCCPGLFPSDASPRCW